MDLVFRTNYHIDPTAVDRFGRLLPSMVLRYAQEVAGKHCDILSLSYEQLAEKGMFWAVVRNRLQITRLPMVGESITIETWPMPTTRTAYPRSTVGYDKDGNELFRSVSLWVLMDLNSRTMVLPGKSGIVVDGTLRGTELSTPRSLGPKLMTSSHQRCVRFTDLDRNGHMNNARYLDWIADLLPSTFHCSHPLTDVTLCYINEALEGQELTLHHEFDSEGSLLVDIHREKENDHDRIFAAKLSFR